MKNVITLVLLWTVASISFAQTPLTPDQIQAAREAAMSITKTNQGAGTTERQNMTSDLFGSSPSAVVQGQDLTVQAAAYLSMSGKLTCPTTGTKLVTISAIEFEVLECLYSGNDVVGMRLRACRDLMNGGRCHDTDGVVITDKFTATTEVAENASVTFWPGDTTTPDGLILSVGVCGANSCSVTGKIGWGGSFHPNTITDQANNVIAQQGANSMVADINATANSSQYADASSYASQIQGQCFFNQMQEVHDSGSITACDGSNTTQVYESGSNHCAQEQICAQTQIEHHVYDTSCTQHIRTYPIECQTRLPNGECAVSLERAPYDCHDVREVTPEVCHFSYTANESTCHRRVDVTINRSCTPGTVVHATNVKYDYSIDGPFYPVVVHCDSTGQGYQITIPDNNAYWQQVAAAERNNNTIAQQLTLAGITMSTVASWGAYGTPRTVTADTHGSVASTAIATNTWSIDTEDSLTESLSFEITCDGGATCNLAIDLTGSASCVTGTCALTFYPWNGVTTIDAGDSGTYPIFVNDDVTRLGDWIFIKSFSARNYLNLTAPFEVRDIVQTEVDECP